MNPETISILNTVLLSAIFSLVGIIYHDLRKNMQRMDRQVRACLVALITIVNRVDGLPSSILETLNEAAQEK